MLPFRNTKERFDVVDLGDGHVGLHHTGIRRYVFMSGTKVEATDVWNREELRCGGAWWLMMVSEMKLDNEIQVHSSSVTFIYVFFNARGPTLVRTSLLITLLRGFGWSTLEATRLVCTTDITIVSSRWTTIS